MLNRLSPRSDGLSLLRAIASALALRMIAAALAFFYTLAIAQNLGADEAGQYFLALSAAMFLSTLARAGLDNAVVRFASVAVEQGNWIGLRHLFRIAVGVVLLLSLTVAAIVCLLAGPISTSIWGNPAMASVLRVTAISIVSFSLMAIQSEFLRAIGDLRASVLVSSILHVATGLVLITPLVRRFGPEGAALSFLVATILSCCFATWWWHRRISYRPENGQRLSMDSLFNSAINLLVIAVAGQAVMPYAPTLLLGVWGSEGEVAIFSVATRISMLVALLLVATNIVVASRFANLYELQDFKGIERVAKFASIILAVATLPLFVVGAVWSSSLMSIFGEDFRSGGTVLIVLLLGQYINAMTGSIGLLLMMTGGERELRILTLVSAGSLVVLCGLLIPLCGGMGAAAATTAANVILNFSATYIAQRNLGIQVTAIPRFSFLDR